MTEEPKKARAMMSRRTLCYGIGGLIALTGLGTLRFAPRTTVVRPPGGQDESSVLGGCLRCARCVEACPRGVIKLTNIEDGIVGMLTPQMTFDGNYCDFCAEENGGVPLCAGACPSGALVAEPDGSTYIIGKAELDTSLCLAHYGTNCRRCYDMCPFEAMALDGQGRPYVLDVCNGCGACERSCLSLMSGSLSLAGNTSIDRAIVVKPLGEEA